MAGITGPIPNRSDQRIRRNKPETPIETVTAIGVTKIPDLGIPDAHEMVVGLYDSMQSSAQSVFYEPSDWAYTRIALFLLDDLLKNRGARGASQKIVAVNQMLTSLLLTEGDRRRVRIEVERNRAAGDVLDVAALFRERLTGTA